MLLNTFELHNPRSLDEAVKIYSKHDSIKIQAGGTFLLNSLKIMKKRGAKTPQNILNLAKIDELNGIEISPNKIVIKSMTSINQIFESKELLKTLPILKIICRNISTQPIRNVATIGGNLTCRYTWTEMPAVMIALKAQLHFTAKDRTESQLDVEGFFKESAKTDKILTAIEIPNNTNRRCVYQRATKTGTVDIPMLSLIISAAHNQKALTDVRFSVNNCTQFAQRDNILEDFLEGKTLTEETIKNALENIKTEIYDTRSTDYKQHMFRVSIKNALTDLMNQKYDDLKNK